MTGILGVNVYLHRPLAESFLYSLALAVGLVPELLPAIVSVNLARGARRMVEVGVIVKDPKVVARMAAVFESDWSETARARKDVKAAKKDEKAAAKDK